MKSVRKKAVKAVRRASRREVQPRADTRAKWVKFKVPAEVMDLITPILKKRGADLETYLRLQITALSRSRRVVGPDDTMPFGKYFGEPVRDVCRGDPRYISWLMSVENPPGFTKEVHELMNEIEESENSEVLQVYG